MKTFNIDELNNNYIKLGVYGLTGAGKTHYSIAHGLKTLYGSTELNQSIMTIKNSVKLGSEVHADNKYISIESTADIDRFIALAEDKSKEYDLIVLDNITGLEDLTIAELPKTGITSLGTISQAGYGKIVKEVKTYIAKFNNLKCNTLLIAHALELRDDRGNVDVRLAMIGKGALNVFTKGLNVCGYLVKRLTPESEKVRDLVLNEPSYICKESPYLGYYERGTLKELIEKLEKGIIVDNQKPAPIRAEKEEF